MRVLSTIFCVALLTIACEMRGQGQQTQPAAEQRVALTESAVALDAAGAAALEGRLVTTMLNGSQDSPVTNIRLVIKNAGPRFYNYVSGWATFYDGAAVRCGEGSFKVDALGPGESAETDTPGLRLRCAPATWRIVATNLLTRTSETANPAESKTAEATTPPSTPGPREAEMPAPKNLIISIDNQEHPVQLNHPIVLKVGGRQHTIIIRSAP